MNNWVDLSGLPKKNGIGKNKDRLVTDWDRCLGYKCKFKYRNIEDELELLKYDKKKNRIYFLYNNQEYHLSFKGFMDANFKSFLEIHDVTYKYNIGEIINTQNASIVILKQTYTISSVGRRKSAYEVQCLKCGHTYILEQDRIPKFQYCPVCINRIVVKGINDLWTTYPEIASFLTDKEDGYKYSKGSNVSLNFTCKYCGESSKHFLPMVVKSEHVPCTCSNSYSLPNKVMFYMLKELSITFEKEKTFSWSNCKRYDFYIESLSTIIEMHGGQHYKRVSKFDKTENDFIKRIKNDNWKKEIALKNNIKNYVVIDCSVNTFESIIKNILSSELLNIIDISGINIETIKKNAYANICETISEYWNNGIYETNKIADYIGLTREFVVSKLHLCNELGLINYDKSLSKKISQKHVTASRYQHFAKPLKCNELDLYFGNNAIASREFGKILNEDVSPNNISRVLLGERKSYKRYTFSYVSRLEFNQKKIESPNKTFGDLFLTEEELYNECVS